MATQRLTAIHIYPVKSCRAVELESVEVSRTGLTDDRLFQVVDASGTPITQRQRPELATVQPRLDAEALHLSADTIAPLSVARPDANDTTVKSLLGVPVGAADAGDEAASWFGELLDQPCRLVAMTEASNHRLPGADVPLSWADAAPVLVTNAASKRWLEQHASEPFGMDRFRPNLTVEIDEPWSEDTWVSFTIGSVEVTTFLPWPRCTIPQVDQRSGERHQEPARVLRRHRWCVTAPDVDPTFRPLLEGSALFGIACSVAPVGATISVGDELSVTSTGAPAMAAPLDAS